MILYPAIDIRGGRAVRLRQGDYERETVYDEDPADAARRWCEAGAQALHVVDLDGARKGAPLHLDAIERITAAVDCAIQVGGGLRDADAVEATLAAGAERVVIGTAALRHPAFLEAMLDQHGDRVIVSVDARNGRVSLAGWTETSDVDAAAAVADLTGRGSRRFLFTPIEVDGTLEGPGLDELERVARATDAELLYSGGVGSLDDLRSLASRAPVNVTGAIVGRALYDRRFSVSEAVAALAAEPVRDR
ncbi:MAG TPA: 1-(5-phosphoribosyl)-5-[(5-phosphoribosylamino)methylideneamino]imidazole-4-carboxamide isomerase [Solirubrobacterales bacterium]|nr:1-(5-phosphoribosyl)-5-[(5-phosphoribosylamino)methylideneamino]imidazole-4-carboxamide isomerase [Solirubrobacterales bacterium]